MFFWNSRSIAVESKTSKRNEIVFIKTKILIYIIKSPYNFTADSLLVKVAYDKKLASNYTLWLFYGVFFKCGDNLLILGTKTVRLHSGPSYYKLLKFDLHSGREQNMKIDKYTFLKSKMMAKYLYFYGRQFVGQSCIWFNIGVI